MAQRGGGAAKKIYVVDERYQTRLKQMCVMPTYFNMIGVVFERFIEIFFCIHNIDDVDRFECNSTEIEFLKNSN